VASGSNLLKSGSMKIGAIKTAKTTTPTEGIQNQNHHRVGALRMTQKSSITSRPPKTSVRRKLFVASQNQLPHPCTESPYFTEKWWPTISSGRVSSEVTSRSRNVNR